MHSALYRARRLFYPALISLENGTRPSRRRHYARQCDDYDIGQERDTRPRGLGKAVAADLKLSAIRPAPFRLRGAATPRDAMQQHQLLPRRRWFLADTGVQLPGKFLCEARSGQDFAHTPDGIGCRCVRKL